MPLVVLSRATAKDAHFTSQAGAVLGQTLRSTAGDIRKSEVARPRAARRVCSRAGLDSVSYSSATANSISLRVDIRGLHHLSPFIDLGFDECPEFVGRIGFRQRAEADERLGDLGTRDCAQNLLVQALDDVPAHARRHEDAVP